MLRSTARKPYWSFKQTVVGPKLIHRKFQIPLKWKSYFAASLQKSDIGLILDFIIKNITAFQQHSETGQWENNISEFWLEHIPNKMLSLSFTLKPTVTHQQTGAAAGCAGTEPNQIISGTNI